MSAQTIGSNPQFGQFPGQGVFAQGAGGQQLGPNGTPTLSGVRSLGQTTNKLQGQADAYANSAASLDSVVSPDQLEALNIAQQNLALNKNMYQLTARATQDFLKTTLQVAQGWFA